MNDPKEALKSILGGFFKYNFYKKGIIDLREALENTPYYKNSWDEVTIIILTKNLFEGEALSFMNNSANIPLFENTDEEAYNWLNLMLVNASRPIGQSIINYDDVFSPK